MNNASIKRSHPMTRNTMGKLMTGVLLRDIFYNDAVTVDVWLLSVK